MTLPILLSLSALFGYLHPVCLATTQESADDSLALLSIQQNDFTGIAQFDTQEVEPRYSDYLDSYYIEYQFGFDYYNERNEFIDTFITGTCTSQLIEGTTEGTWRISYSYEFYPGWVNTNPLLQFPYNNWFASVLICQYNNIIDIFSINYSSSGIQSYSFTSNQFTATENQALTRLTNSQIYPVLMLSTNPSVNDFYIHGYNDKSNESSGINLGNYLFAIADVPFYTIRQFFNDSLFGGPSLFLILMSLVTFALVIGLIRRFWK